MSDPARRTGNVGIAGDGSQTWIVWDDAEPDQSDTRLHLVEFDGVTAGSSRTFDREDSAAKPSIAVNADQLALLRLVGCAEGPCPAPDRGLVLTTFDRATGRWSDETVAPQHEKEDHGQSNVALAANGDIHVCYVLKLYGALNDDTWCTSRDATGGWTAPFHVTDGQNGADDHPRVLVPADGGPIRVGYTTMEANGRQAAVWFEEFADRHVFNTGPNTGDDAIVVEGPDGSVHAAWREMPGPGRVDFELHHATCAAPCTDIAAWETEVVRAVPEKIDSFDSLMTPDGLLLMVWTEDETTVKVGWLCPDGLHVDRPDAGVGAESSERGQPSLRFDPDLDQVHVVYTKEVEGGTAVRWASRPTPTCP